MGRNLVPWLAGCQASPWLHNPLPTVPELPRVIASTRLPTTSPVVCRGPSDGLEPIPHVRSDTENMCLAIRLDDTEIDLTLWFISQPLPRLPETLRLFFGRQVR